MWHVAYSHRFIFFINRRWFSFSIRTMLLFVVIQVLFDQKCFVQVSVFTSFIYYMNCPSFTRLRSLFDLTFSVELIELFKSRLSPPWFVRFFEHWPFVSRRVEFDHQPLFVVGRCVILFVRCWWRHNSLCPNLVHDFRDCQAVVHRVRFHKLTNFFFVFLEWLDLNGSIRGNDGCSSTSRAVSWVWRCVWLEYCNPTRRIGEGSGKFFDAQVGSGVYKILAGMVAGWACMPIFVYPILLASFLNKCKRWHCCLVHSTVCPIEKTYLEQQKMSDWFTWSTIL